MMKNTRGNSNAPFTFSFHGELRKKSLIAILLLLFLFWGMVTFAHPFRY